MMPKISARAAALVAALALATSSAAAAAPALPALPALPDGAVVEYQAGGNASQDLAVILSGDGGWADLDRQLGTILVARGTSVIGVDNLKYFWQTRSPDEVARDMDGLIRHYLAAWHKDRLVLIGFSFGAAIMPFILSRLPQDLKPRLALAAMLGSAKYANWEVHMGDWLHDRPHDSARPVAPELAKLSGVKLLCVYGEEETANSVCPDLSPGKAEILKLPGGHHFDGNYTALAEQILKRAAR